MSFSLSNMYGSSGSIYPPSDLNKRLMQVVYIGSRLDESLVLDVTSKGRVVIEKFSSAKHSQQWEMYELTGTVADERRHAFVNVATRQALQIKQEFFGGKAVYTGPSYGEQDFVWLYSDREECIEYMLLRSKKRQFLDVKNEKKSPGMHHICITFVPHLCHICHICVFIIFVLYLCICIIFASHFHHISTTFPPYTYANFIHNSPHPLSLNRNRIACL